MAKKLERLFPTLIARGRLARSAGLNRDLLGEIRELAANDRAGREWSRENYRGGYTSYGSMTDLHHRAPAFSGLADALLPHVKAFAKAQGWKARGSRPELTALWANVMPRHTYHTLHLHPHSAISGVYYVTAPRGSVSLKIEDPRMAFYMNAPVRAGLYHEVRPAEGSFVLFESWLRHEVPPNRSASPRVSLSFNYSL